MLQKNEALDPNENIAELRLRLEKALENLSSSSKMQSLAGSSAKEKQKTIRASSAGIPTPIRVAAMLILMSGGGMIMLAIVAKMIRDYSLPKYISTIGSFVLGFVAVLVLQLIIGYFNDED